MGLRRVLGRGAERCPGGLQQTRAGRPRARSTVSVPAAACISVPSLVPARRAAASDAARDAARAARAGFIPHSLSTALSARPRSRRRRLSSSCLRLKNSSLPDVPPRARSSACQPQHPTPTPPARLPRSYIHQKPAGGVHEYLCNRLFALPDNAVEDILSQLCELAVRPPTPSASVQRALVGLAGRSTRTALKVRRRHVSTRVRRKGAGRGAPARGHFTASCAEDRLPLSTSFAGAQVYWLLRTISQDQRDAGKAVHSLLQACEEAALHVHSPVCGTLAPGDAPGAPERNRRAPRPADGRGGADAVSDDARMTRLSRQLGGDGEGVTHLVKASLASRPLPRPPLPPPTLRWRGACRRHDHMRLNPFELRARRTTSLSNAAVCVQASLDDLSSGGTGLLSRSPPRDPAPAPPASALSARRFRATLTFLDLVCTCSASLTPMPPPQRASALRRRLEDLNARLLDADLQSQVRARTRHCLVAEMRHVRAWAVGVPLGVVHPQTPPVMGDWVGNRRPPR